jgi:hypothetical protein
MKLLILAGLTALFALSGCSSMAHDGNTAKSEESYVPLGTLIARKSPSRSDGVTIIDKQALENDRTMGNGTLNPK